MVTLPQTRRRTPSGSDAAYQSLRRLLLSAPANSEQLEAMDRNALYGSIGFYLSAMALPNVREFAEAIATSQSLWTPTSDSAHVLVNRTMYITQALAFATDERIQLIMENVARHSPERAGKDLCKWVRAVLDGIQKGIDTQGTRTTTLIPRLAVVTGLLRGVEAARQERRHAKKPSASASLHLRSLASTLEREWADYCVDQLTLLGEEHEPRSVRGARLATVALAAQCIDLVPESRLQRIEDRAWIDSVLPALLDIFGCADSLKHLDGLMKSVTHSAQGIYVPADAPCTRWASSVEAHALYPLAGPVSRLLADALRRQCTALAPTDAEEALGEKGTDLLPTLHRIGFQLDAPWCSSPLAGAETEDIEMASRERTKALWQVMKTLLFAVTMVLDAVVDAVVEQCPSPSETYDPPRNAMSPTGYPAMASSNTPLPYLHVITDVVHIYLPFYFITTQFGLDGFESYRKVFYSALDVIGRDPETCTQLTAALADAVSRGVSPEAVTAQGADYAQRIHTTYFLLVAEQLVSDVPEAMVDRLLLPICRPYLEDTTFQDAFESAHSVVLALFSAQSPCTLDLTPFYVQLLLSSFPGHLNDTQLHTALTTVVASLSDRSDSLAWWCVEQLSDELSQARMADQEDRTLTLARCLASLISHVNLVLLRSLLNKVSAQILMLPEASAARTELVEATFAALGDMNASTREEGMRWWLEKSPSFTRGMPADA